MLANRRETGAHARPYLRNRDVQWGCINVEELPTMDFDSDDALRFGLIPGDVLVCEGGEVGRAAVWNGQLDECYFQKALHRVRTSKALIPHFLRYLLEYYARTNLFAQYTSGITISHLPQEDLRNLTVLVPPVSEQLRIVAAIEEQISRLDAGVAILERVRANLAKLADAVSLRAFNLPEESSQSTALGDLCERITKGTTPTSVGHTYTNKGIRFVKVESLVGGKIDHKKCAYISPDAHTDLARSQLQVDDLLVSIAGTLGRVGEVAERDIPANTNQALAIVRLKDRTLVRYVKAWLESPKLRSVVRTSGKGVGMGNLTLEQIRNIPVSVPDATTRAHILSQIHSAVVWVERANEDVEKAWTQRARLRSSILATAFSGRLVSQDPTDESAAVLFERIAAERASTNNDEPDEVRGRRGKKVTA
jgi:type I restriction enzyme S subunit